MTNGVPALHVVGRSVFASFIPSRALISRSPKFTSSVLLEHIPTPVLLSIVSCEFKAAGTGRPSRLGLLVCTGYKLQQLLCTETRDGIEKPYMLLLFYLFCMF